MKVYRVKSDVAKYEWLVPSVPDEEILALTTFDCSERSSDWAPPIVSVLDTSALKGDFAYYTPGALVAASRSIHNIGRFFQLAGELLELRCGNEIFSLLNITYCVNALNLSRTEWNKTQIGSNISIKRPCFRTERLANLKSTLFKIPETSHGSVLTLELDRDPRYEFKAFVESTGLEGLIFDEIWDAELEVPSDRNRA